MGGSVNGGVNGMPLDWDLPLPLYSFTPGPEWTQTQDAAQTANRLSFYYEDVYQNDQGATLTFIQEMAITGTQLPAGSTLTEGDTLILFSQGQTTDGTHQSTAIYWIQGPSLLTLHCDRHLSENQMLEFFPQVGLQRSPPTGIHPHHLPMEGKRGRLRQLYRPGQPGNPGGLPLCRVFPAPGGIQFRSQ